MFGTQSITFVNGIVLGGDGRTHSSLRVRRSAIDALGAAPKRGDAVIDLNDAIVLPGLINSHEHLELNSFNRLKWRARYANVREWIADFQPRFGRDPELALARADTLADRVWVGGLKNLLSGVTTVCHHNPLHRTLAGRFPVRVVRQFGFSHSLQIDGRAVARSYERTPSRWPWVIHAAEGVDSDARAEIDALESLGCVRPNTVLVHGVGIDEQGARRVLSRGGALVWCPSSNHFLFERTADVRTFDTANRVALGTDSRLSGEGDLLDELRAARETGQLTPERLVRSVTSNAAAMFRLRDAGRLAVGRPADLIVLRRRDADPFASVVSSRRTDVRLTMIGGAPLCGDHAMRHVFDTRRQKYVTGAVDGVEKLVARWIARKVARMRLSEPGLELAS
jgi:cytosine/adenosine deaminase-related metal-dependent hydrolase